MINRPQHTAIGRIKSALTIGLLSCFVLFSVALSLEAILGLKNDISIDVVEEQSNPSEQEQETDGSDVFFIMPSALNTIGKSVSAPMASIANRPTQPSLKQVTPPPERAG